MEAPDGLSASQSSDCLSGGEDVLSFSLSLAQSQGVGSALLARSQVLTPERGVTVYLS